MNDLVSVIIPVYNREMYIEECIASLQAQSYKNYEIILIDDGSTDNTLEICRKLATEDSRIVLLDGGHGGVSAARNKGLDIATGTYLFFLDSDDAIHPLLLQELVENMERTGATMGGTDVWSVPADSWHLVEKRIEKATAFCGTDYKTHQEALHEIFITNTPLNMIGGVMMRRDWVGATRFREDLTIGEDFYFIYENLVKGASAIFLKKKRYYGRTHADNTSWDFGYTGFWTRFLRRELVWKNEETMGRTEHAKLQKQQAFGCYLQCLKQNKPHSEDVRKMRKTIRRYKRTLLPALPFKSKLRYYLSVFTPGLYRAMTRTKNKQN